MKITIVTPIYYGERFLSGLLAMVKDNVCDCNRNNIDVNIEYILVNDSPEHEINIDNPYEDLFVLKVITNSQNTGIHQARINGLNAASGDYIIFFDQDDHLLANAISSSVQKIGDADFLISNGYHRKGATRQPIYKSLMAQKMATTPIFFEYCTSLLASPGHALLKKNAIPAEWIDSVMYKSGSDDYFLWLLLLDRKVKMAINTVYVYEHIDTKQNFSLDRRKMYESSYSFCEMAKNNNLLNEKMPKQNYSSH